MSCDSPNGSTAASTKLPVALSLLHAKCTEVSSDGVADGGWSNHGSLHGRCRNLLRRPSQRGLGREDEVVSKRRATRTHASSRRHEELRPTMVKPPHHAHKPSCDSRQTLLLPRPSQPRSLKLICPWRFLLLDVTEDAQEGGDSEDAEAWTHEAHHCTVSPVFIHGWVFGALDDTHIDELAVIILRHELAHPRLPCWETCAVSHVDPNFRAISVVLVDTVAHGAEAKRPGARHKVA